jgi:hypothetical protein
VAEFVVDTNVWVMPDREVDTLDTVALLNCAETCRSWLHTLCTGEHEAVVDDVYAILGEYRPKLRRGGFSEKLLNTLMKTNRLIYRAQAVHPDGTPVLPLVPELARLDASDQKFAAVALASTPPTPIVDATDSDWKQHGLALKQVGLIVIELCPDCLRRWVAS